jgi:two-component system sensor histidine kinase NblS
LIRLLSKIRDLILRWWGDFTLQTRLMAGATLMVSLIMSGLTFWAVNTIQHDARLNDTRFARDLGLLLAANVAPLVDEADRTELARFSYSFYQSTSSVRYMLYADGEGEIFFGIPFSEAAVQNSLTLRRRMQLPGDYARNADRPNGAAASDSGWGKLPMYLCRSTTTANTWVCWPWASTRTPRWSRPPT